ncbi:MAG TPA: ABC transporter ATP-binding protein [Xanthobacteraceae bacterium]|jgi:ATP-binding cassette subfamily B protein
MKTSANGSSNAYSTPALVRRLLVDEALGHWQRYVLAFALMAAAAISMAFITYLFGTLTNEAYVHRDFQRILFIGAITIMTFAVKGLATYGSSVMLSAVGNRVVADSQRRMFDKLLQQDMRYFADRHSSEFIARLTRGTMAVSSVIALMITAIGRDLVLLIALSSVMVFQDPIMALGGLLVAPPALLFLRKVIPRIRGIAQMQFTVGTRIIETMQEALQGIRMVKAFCLEEEMQQRFAGSVEQVKAQSNKMTRVAYRASPLMETLGGFAVLLAVIYGGWRTTSGGATPGELVSFLAAFLLAYEPAKRLARLNIELNNNLVGVRVLYEVIDTAPGEPSDNDCPPIKVTVGRLEFAGVNFAYRPRAPVLRNMNFLAEPGRLTALVGPSGAGKSTVLDLILRIYNIDSGRISIDGQNIDTISRASLRGQIAYVGQVVQLFRGTIRENIALGRLGVSEAEIIVAAKAAQAHDFIVGFPRGYDTPVGEHGMQLSGGQRQRLAIARALIRGAPIILLDEATASLDSEAERHLQAAMAELRQGRTTLVIAHRLATIMHADNILVLQDGSVVESGRHDELLRNGGCYASFYRLQLEQHAPAMDTSNPNKE